MNSFVKAGFAVSLLSVSLVNFSTYCIIDKEMYLDFPSTAQANAITRVAVGQLITISLPSNVTTGYCWNFAKPLYDEAVLVLEDEGFILEEPITIGVGGVKNWLFRAITPGKTTVNLEYKRPWEKVPAVQNVSYTFIVE